MDVSLQSRRDHNHVRDGGGGSVQRAPLGLPERSDSMQKRFPNHASLFAAAHAHALQWLQAQVQWRAAGLLLVGLLVVPFVLADVCSRSSSDCFSLVAGRSSLTVLDYWQQPQQMTEEQVLLQRTLEEKERQKNEQGDADGGRVEAAAEIAAARSVGTTTGGGGEGKVGAVTVEESLGASAAALQGEGEKSDDYAGADADAESDAANAAAAAAAASLAKEDAEAAAVDDAAVMRARAKTGVSVEGSRRAALTSAAVSSSALRVDAGGNSGGGKQRVARRSRSTSDAGSSSPGSRDEVMQEEKRGVSGQVRVLQKEAAASAVDGEVVLTASALSSDGARSTEGRRRGRREAGAAAVAAAVVRPDANRALTSFSGDAVAGRSELATPGDGAVNAAGAKRIKIASSSSGKRRRGSGRRDQWQRNPSEVAEREETGGGGEKESLRRRRSSKRRRALEGALLNPEEQGGPLLPVGMEGQSRTVSTSTNAAAQEEDSRGELTLWHKLCAAASSVPALAPLVQAAC